MIEGARLGFIYQVTVRRRNGDVEVDPPVHNLIPTAGLNHILSTVLDGGTQVGTWYVGLFSNNYTPIAGDTASSFPGNAGESTAYDESARVEYVPGSIASGAVNNNSSPAEFTMSGTATIYGGFIASASAKSSTSGTLLSAAKFSSPKSLADGDVLSIKAGFTLTSS